MNSLAINQILRLFRVLFSVVLLTFLVSSCKETNTLKYDFILAEGFDSISVRVKNLSTDEVKTQSAKNSFSIFMEGEIDDYIEVTMASYKPGTSDTTSLIVRTYPVYEGHNSMEISPQLKNEPKVKWPYDYPFSSEVTFSWDWRYYTGNAEVYVSEDSANIFKKENLVATDVITYSVPITGQAKFFAVKLFSSFGSSWYEVAKSSVYRVQYLSPYDKVAEPNVWVNYAMKDYNYLYWHIPVTKGAWYIIEAYDALNDDTLTGAEMVFFLDTEKEIRTRTPDGCPFFFIADSSEVVVTSAVGGFGELGTFRFRVKEITPVNEGDMNGEHQFNGNTQVVFAKKDLDPGKHLIKTYQTDILNEAFVYYSFVVDGQIAQIEEFSYLQLGSNLGPNSREDTAAQFNYITLDQASTVQMIMINSYHGTPASLFVEID